MSYGGYGGGAQCCSSMHVESACVGRIIGRGGSKIKELEQESNARIKISRDEDENGMKSVEISGADEDIAAAKEMIQQCLEDDYRGGGSRGYGGGGGGRYGGGGGRRDDGWGRRDGGGGGWGRRDQDGGGYGRRDRDGGDGWGRRDDYGRDDDSTGDRRGRGGGGGGFGGSETESVYVDKSEVGRIIGRGGSKIREIEQESGCSIKVARDGSSPSEVVLSANSRGAIEEAKRMIQDAGVELLDSQHDCGRGW